MLQQLKTGQRLALGFTVVLVSTIVVSAIGYLGLRTMANEMDVVTSERVGKVTQARDVRDNVMAQTIAVRNIMLSEIGDERVREKDSVLELRQKNSSILKAIEDTETDQRAKELLATVIEGRKAYREAVDKVVEASMSSAIDLAKEYLRSDLTPAQARYVKNIDAFVAHEVQLLEAAQESARKQAGTIGLVMLLVTCLAVAAATGIGWLVTRSVTRPLGGEPDDVRAVALAIAGGDLTRPVDTSRATPGSLVESMSQMQASLRTMVAQVRSSSDNIATGSAEIASGNVDLSHRTEQQAGSLQQTASSMEELTSTVRNNGDTARQAHALAMGAAAAATQGGERVGGVVDTMRSIASSSSEIADIIGVIDGIAFQTNILALNAAVEAARAGEQGRGFAVVASEVRALAQRSAHAAKDIKSLIQASVEKVDAGTRQVDEAGQSMQDIVRQVQDVSRMLGEIATATSEQAQGIEQVNGAVSQLDETTQRNAALVEQSSAAAQSLKDQAEALQRVVASFRLA